MKPLDIPASLIFKWHQMAQVEYAGLYTRLFISYNAWYRRVTGGVSDKESMTKLKRRHVIWDEILEGPMSGRFITIIKSILSLDTGLSSTAVTWHRCIRHERDWQGVIDFWYAVRCDVFHGNVDPTESLLLRYAYESLNVFMSEVVRRMSQSFQEDDRVRLEELERLIAAEGQPLPQHLRERAALYTKFIRSPEIWNVDMERVSNVAG